MPKTFSVIIATCNREKFVCEAIESVLQQSFTDYEIILVDDGTDAKVTEKITGRYGGRLSVVQSNEGGSERAYQLGASVATGQYLAFLDDDDLYLPWTLNTYAKIIRDLDSPPLILGAIRSVDWNAANDIPSVDKPTDIRALKYTDFFSKDIATGIMSQSRVVMLRPLFQHLNQRKRAEPFVLNDYKLLLSAGPSGPCVITKSPPTVLYRQHDAQATKNVEKMSRGILQLIDHVRVPDYRSRRFDSYAFLGGPITEWSWKAFAARRPGLGIKMLRRGWPMVAAATVKKIRLKLKPAVTAHLLGDGED